MGNHYEEHVKKYGHIYKEIGPLITPFLSAFYGNQNPVIAGKFKVIMSAGLEPEVLREKLLYLIQEAKNG